MNQCEGCKSPVLSRIAQLSVLWPGQDKLWTGLSLTLASVSFCLTAHCKAEIKEATPRLARDVITVSIIRKGKQKMTFRQSI